MARDEKQLVGRWIHAHEEDGAGHRVFRRAGTPLPPSRGRSELVVAPDLTDRRTGPGADDRPGEGDARVIGFGPGDDGPDDRLEALDVTANRLLIAKR